MATGSEIFPLISWIDVVTGGNLTITVDAGSGPVAEVIAVPTSSVYGVRMAAPLSLGRASTDSVAKLLETAILAHSLVTSATAYYEQTGYLYPAYRVNFVCAGFVAMSITGSFDLMRQLGLGNLLVQTSTTEIYSVGFPVGVFAPCVPWSRVEPVNTSQAALVRSPFAPGQASRITVDTSRSWALQWLHVPARHLSTYYAGLSAPAAVAGTQTFDTNGTLDGLLAATLAGSTMRLLTQFSTGTLVDVAWDSNPKTDDFYSWDGENERASVGVGLVQTT
jgi:hypothetical protein